MGIEIGGLIDSEYIKYRKQFSLRKKFVRFVKNKFGQITTETSQKLKSLKSSNSSATKPSPDDNENENDSQNVIGNEWNTEQKSEEISNAVITRTESAIEYDVESGDLKREKREHRHHRKSKKRKRKRKKHRSRRHSQKVNKTRTRKRESVSHHGTPVNHSRARTMDVRSIEQFHELELNHSLPNLMSNGNRSN